MSLGIASAVAGATSQAQIAANSPIETPSEKNAAAKVAALKQWANVEQTGETVKTERPDAVQATPASSPAAVVDFYKDRAVDTDMPEYPVFGSGAGDIEPVEKQWAIKAVPEPADASDTGADVVRLIDQNNNASDPAAGGGVETAAEAGEADLTA